MIVPYGNIYDPNSSSTFLNIEPVATYWRWAPYSILLDKTPASWIMVVSTTI